MILLRQWGSWLKPNTSYLMWHDEWLYYSHNSELEKEKISNPDRFDFKHQFFLPLEPYLQFLDQTNPEILLGIRAIYLPGHTKHHIGIELSSQNQVLLYIADLFIHPIFLYYSDLIMPFDRQKETLVTSRQQILENASQQQFRVLGYHFPFLGLGFIQNEAGTYLWQAFSNETSGEP